MRPSPLVSISSSCRLLARRPTSFNPSKDPLDIANTVGPIASSFDFPLTRPTLLKMEKQRQILHYLRLEQLQFKDLLAFRQPFNRPPKSHFIQVRHQHYQGESHPASRKVTISLPVSQLPLSPSQLHKFKLLAGSRFTPSLPSTSSSSSPSPNQETQGTFKISCELYPSERMNEKWCSDTLDKLLKECKEGKDSYEDVPLDLRGARKRLVRSGKGKKTLGLKDFPKEWLGQSSK